MRNRMATADLTTCERERNHILISGKIAAEGIVLLENRGGLPFDSDVKSIALFGSGARRTIKGGTGSGDVNVRDYISVEQGLKNAGYEIVTEGWLSEHDNTMVNAESAYDDHIRELSHQGISIALLTMMGKPFKEPEFRSLRKDDLKIADAAVYVLARNSGEGADRKNVPGDYQLTDTEIQDISLLAEHYNRLVLLLNVGGVMDIEPIRELPGAILLISQGGSSCGDAVADVISGKITPSGKLTATWARQYEDYPHASEFTAAPDDVTYKEGLFVGYRWFDSIGIEPRYPFGYGRSYTDFTIHMVDVSVTGNAVSISAFVTNTGEYPGQEVLQVYVSQPTERLIKPAQILTAFKKTKSLQPGEAQQVEIIFQWEQLASYDEVTSTWVLEAGEYIVRVGNSSRNTVSAAVLTLMREAATQQCKSLLRNEPLDEITVPNIRQEYDCPRLVIDAEKIATVIHTYTQGNAALPACEKLVSFQDVLCGKATAEELVGLMTTDEMILLCIGAARVSFSDFSVIGNASRSIPGAAGDTTGLLTHYGIPQCAMADGPAGIRVNPKIYERHDGYINNIAEDPILGKVLPPKLQQVDLRGTTVKYQYCTALPIATQLAQTWNPALLEQAGDLVGTEMEDLGIDLWLAPGMNIQRNPLCGRNFEYYSEDPLLTGVFAAAMTRGVQKHAGKGVTIKHLAANNQETNRSTSNSHVSERALREIYLKGFEICVRESRPLAAMTSMNLINGVHTANDRDLLTHVLRDEWGFDGTVMTDWGTTGSFVSVGEPRSYGPSTSEGCITAGNDLIMPGTQHDEDALKAAVANGRVPLGDLQACALRVLNLLIKCAPGMEV